MYFLLTALTLALIEAVILTFQCARLLRAP